EQFRFLRDGGDFENEAGEIEHFDGQLFEETVFNQSIQEFLNKKEQLADYFNEGHTEDIFDYIPAQKTNQIYTPKWIVAMMVDLLEKENPDIFKNKENKFIDLYTKSGLYLTELVKRLNVGLKDEIPDETERIKYILEHQIYAIAPSEIIYSIAKTYIYDTDKADNIQGNLKMCDLVPSAQNGTVKEKLAEIYGDENLKFDVVIGNPPYQDESVGDSTQAPPIYHKFMDEAYKIADKVELITPARFLFNAGATGKAWNEKMLSDEHLKVLYFEQDSSKIFPNTDIKGGVAVTYRSVSDHFGTIGTFTSFEELNSILHKVLALMTESFSTIIYPQTKVNQQVDDRFPTERRMRPNWFEKFPEIFLSESDEQHTIKIVGLEKGNKRTERFVSKDIIVDPNLEKYKVFIPKANGSGAIGEVLSTPLIGEPLIGEPLIGVTGTFYQIGSFDTEVEAINCMNYVKSKFARTMLGVLKITQDNPPTVWAKVPLQDFSLDSDIDWTKSIPEIDQQLYVKYGLSQDEIAFIEVKVKAME
ncbi:MAG: hypothetical protein GYA51_10480, partial [Candidatus Methanofastidiosa archaeon]|nr:hypothetical protein [Candidatus Methanofastidiosa archaeon]